MDTLVLNQAYQPVDRICWREAIKNWWLGKVEILEEYEDRVIRSVTFEMHIPAVVRLLEAFNGKKRGVKFSRENVGTRDKWRCQYCNRKVAHHEATYDHVVPRREGGKTNWTNIVIACSPCNVKKGGRRPEAAGMRLLHGPPEKPKSLPETLRLTFITKKNVPDSWKQYLTSVMYWQGELESDGG